jgi:hypothetical protein
VTVCADACAAVRILHGIVCAACVAFNVEVHHVNGNRRNTPRGASAASLPSIATEKSIRGSLDGVRVELRQQARMVRVAVFDEDTGFTAEAPPLKRDQSGGWG